MNKILTSIVISTALILTGCSSAPEATPTADAILSEQLSTAKASLTGEQAQIEFQTIATKTQELAKINGVTEILTLEDGIQRLIYDPTSVYKHNAIFFQEWTKGYGAYETTDMFITFSATKISKDSSTTIEKLNDGIWKLSNGSNLYNLKIKDGVVISALSASSDGKIQWSAEIIYSVSNDDKQHVTKANQELGFKE